MENTTTFLHDGTIGDVWASLPAIREYVRLNNKKAVIYLTNGQLAKYYDGATHPTRDSENRMVMLNEKIINMMIPLLKAQPYIADAKMHEEELVHINLNMIRETFVNQPYHSLSRWYFYVFPDLTCDLSEACVEIPDADKDLAKGKLIVCRTERYLNQSLDYSFLKQYGDDVVFAGTELEYTIFKLRFGLNIQHLVVNDFLELAQAIKQSKGLLSNQTQIFQIAEQMKKPRAVELCRFAPNVEPIGNMAYEIYSQGALEFATDILLTGSKEAVLDKMKKASKKEA